MAGSILRSITEAISHLEYVILAGLGRRPPPALEYIPALVCSTEQAVTQKAPFDINSIFDGFLWGVPTCRRSAEKRMMRKFGAPNWHNKLILPKKNLKECNACGHYHEERRLCPNCYAKVMEETKAMQEKIIAQLGINPIEKDVAVVYEGEKRQFDDEFLKTRNIVEMEKPRPRWFSKNLLQKSGSAAVEQGSSEATAIKPHELG
nr:EOG090X0IGM [Macrothrix elegans]